MADVQKTSSINPGELAQRFVQFVMIQSQNILFLLGQIPSHDGQAMPPNFEAAKMLIDQLEMIKEKTRGNLSPQETAVLEKALNSTRLAFVEVSGGTSPSMMPSPSYGETADFLDDDEPVAPPAAKKAEPSPARPAAVTPPPASAPAEVENKKKFTKTYG